MCGKPRYLGAEPRGSVLISVGAGHTVGLPFEVSVEGIIFMRWRGSPSRGRPHFLTGRREKCSSSNRSASKLFKVVLFKKPVDVQMALRMDLGISGFYMENVYSKAISIDWKIMAPLVQI